VQYNIKRVCRPEDAWRGNLLLDEGLKPQSIPQKAQSFQEEFCVAVFEFLIPAVLRSGAREAGVTERWRRRRVGFVAWGIFYSGRD
jgi:hypothetical protein